LTKNGRVFLEIGYKQAPAVKDLLEKAGFDEIRIHKDLNSKDRVLSATVS
jgi:release factor glutamine methyltransferase